VTRAKQKQLDSRPASGPPPSIHVFTSSHTALLLPVPDSSICELWVMLGRKEAKTFYTSSFGSSDWPLHETSFLPIPSHPIPSYLTPSYRIHCRPLREYFKYSYWPSCCFITRVCSRLLRLLRLLTRLASGKSIRSDAFAQVSRSKGRSATNLRESNSCSAILYLV
jgi:hypothetical protein